MLNAFVCCLLGIFFIFFLLPPNFFRNNLKTEPSEISCCQQAFLPSWVRLLKLGGCENTPKEESGSRWASAPCSHLLPRQSWLSPTHLGDHAGAADTVQGWGRALPADCSKKHSFFASWLSQVPSKRLEMHPQLCHWRENDFFGLN